MRGKLQRKSENSVFPGGKLDSVGSKYLSFNRFFFNVGDLTAYVHTSVYILLIASAIIFIYG